MTGLEKLQCDYYKGYVGAYAKRFYQPFAKNHIHKIIGFEMRNGFAHFQLQSTEGEIWWWDVDDCVVITNELPVVNDKRVANVNHPEYKGFNPYY